MRARPARIAACLLATSLGWAAVFGRPATTARAVDALVISGGGSNFVGQSPAGPATAVMTRGAAGTYLNEDVSNHNVEAISKGPDGVTPLFGTDPNVGLGQQVPIHRVETLPVGDYKFFCSFHPWMVGVLSVKDAPAGIPTLPSPPGGTNPAPSNPPQSSDVAQPTSDIGGWPIYGGDLANTRSNPSGPSATQVPLLKQAWEFDTTDGDFTGTPIVAGGRVFAGSSGGIAYAVDAATGARLWSVKLEGPINATAAYDGGRVYFPVARVGSPYVAALDAATGHRLWDALITDQPYSDVYGSPVVFQGDVLVGSSAQNSEVSQQGAGHVRGMLVRLRGSNGKLVWRTPTVAAGHDGGAVWSTPAVDPVTKRIYIGTGNAYTAPADPQTDSILALDFDRGNVVAGFQALAGDVWNAATPGLDYDMGASPTLMTLVDGTQVAAEGQKAGLFWQFDRSTLKPRWNTRVSGGSQVGGIVGSTATDGRRTFGPATTPAEMWSLNPDGSLNWLEPSAEAETKFNAVSYSHGVVYAASSAGTLQAYDPDRGLPLIQLKLAGPTWGGVAIAGGSLFVAVGVGGNSGAIEAFVAPPGPGPVGRTHPLL